MALTEPEYWLAVLGFVLIIGMSLLYFGNSLEENGYVTMDNDSSNYLDNYDRILSNNSFKAEAEKDLVDKDVSNPLLKWLGESKLVSDFFGALTFLSNAVSDVYDFIRLAFHLPSFFIESLGLPIDSLRFLINIFGTVLVLFIVILMVRLIK